MRFADDHLYPPFRRPLHCTALEDRILLACKTVAGRGLTAKIGHHFVIRMSTADFHEYSAHVREIYGDGELTPEEAASFRGMRIETHESAEIAVVVVPLSPADVRKREGIRRYEQRADAEFKASCESFSPPVVG